MTDDRHIPWKEVHDLVGLSRSHVYLLMDRGEFPLPIKTGTAQTSRVFWRLSEIRTWMRTRKRAKYSGVGRPLKKPELAPAPAEA